MRLLLLIVTLLPVAAFAQGIDTFSQKVAASQKQAMAIYPDLAVADSRLNRHFLDQYKRLKDAGDPSFSTDFMWPLELARRCAEDLAIQPVKVASAQHARPANAHTIKEIASDLSGFVGKRIVISGTIDVSNYYNYGFAEAASAFYSFKVTDDTGTAYVYLAKDRQQNLRSAILKGGAQWGDFEILIPKEVTDVNQLEVLAGLLNWSSTTPVKAE